MRILYDFETSSRELIGQILSYSFWVVDEALDPIDILNGNIRLNPTEFPELDAILITKINLDQLQATGISEAQAASNIHHFLNRCIQKYGMCTLTGYNSNQFDLKFLRTLLIKHGLNPYFFGKLVNIDVLHYVHYVAMEFQHHYPWVNAGAYWTFSMESVATAHGVLTTAQSHEAESDVRLMRDLIRVIQERYGTLLKDFIPVQLPHNRHLDADYTTFKESVKGTPPHFSESRYWHRIAATKTELLVANLEKIKATPIQNVLELIDCLRYINMNTHLFITHPLTRDEAGEWGAIAGQVDEWVAHFGLTRNLYFELTQKSWDIQYRIHDLGFERIDTLKEMIARFTSNPSSYRSLINDYWQHKTSEKDGFLIQLFNRYYLNMQPDVPLAHFDRYIIPRYVEHTLYRDREQVVPIDIQLAKAKAMVAEGHPDRDVLMAYIHYGKQFWNRFELDRFFKTNA